MTRIAFLITASTLFATLASASTMTDRLQGPVAASTDSLEMSAAFTKGMSFFDAMSLVGTITLPDLAVDTADRASPLVKPTHRPTTVIPKARAEDIAREKAKGSDSTYRPKR